MCRSDEFLAASLTFRFAENITIKDQKEKRRKRRRKKERKKDRGKEK
jgi:hypothetical protein